MFFFGLSLYIEEVNLQTFGMIKCYLCKKQKKSFIPVTGLKKIKYFHLSVVKMNANYAEICRVGKLEADFQQVQLVPFF